MSHHSRLEDIQMRKLLREIMETSDLGPTGNLPLGKLTDTDEGEIKFAVTRHNDKIIINFGTPIVWIGMTPEQARDFARSLLDRVAEGIPPEGIEKDTKEDVSPEQD